jgi:glutathione S-transferase
MSVKLYYHPLASFCHKVLIALYERDVAFTPELVNLGDKASRDAFAEVWPLLKFPVLVDGRTGKTVAESASVIEYLDGYSSKANPMIPADKFKAWEARMWDRIFDDILQLPMQKIVGDSLRPSTNRDPYGVDEALSQLAQAYGFLESRLPSRGWALGPDFSIADCSAAPAIFYADTVSPLGNSYPNLSSYYTRLKNRPSFARVLREAEPYFHLFPLEPKPKI